MPPRKGCGADGGSGHRRGEPLVVYPTGRPVAAAAFDESQDVDSGGLVALSNTSDWSFPRASRHWTAIEMRPSLRVLRLIQAMASPLPCHSCLSTADTPNRPWSY